MCKLFVFSQEKNFESVWPMSDGDEMASVELDEGVAIKRGE